MMNSIISHSQLAFPKGHSLVDGVMVINEVLDFSKKGKRKCFILKVDF